MSGVRARMMRHGVDELAWPGVRGGKPKLSTQDFMFAAGDRYGTGPRKKPGPIGRETHSLSRGRPEKELRRPARRGMATLLLATLPATLLASLESMLESRFPSELQG